MRRLLAGPLALGVATAALLSTSGGAGRPLSLTAQARQAKETVGFTWTSRGARLARLDKRTLRPLAARSPELGYVDAWAFARPDGGLLAVAAHPDANGTLHDAVRFVQLRNLRLLPRTVPLDGSVRAMLWARLDRVVAVVGDCCAPGNAVATIDTGARRVIATTPLRGNVQSLARAGDALVLLETPMVG